MGRAETRVTCVKGVGLSNQQTEHNAERDGGADTNLCDSSPEGAGSGAVGQRSA